MQDRRGVPNGINIEDITGFSDLIENIDDDNLDVLIDSPGGQAEQTERIVNLLRANFKHIRFIVANAAYSAATMMCLSGNSILMDDRSTLGPIDPQIDGIPSRAIMRGVERVQKILKDDPKALPAYIPMINKYTLHILELCESAESLSESLVMGWMQKYMFKNHRKDRRKVLAERITNALKDFDENKSHGRTIGIEKAKELGIKVIDLRKVPELRKAVWELFCSIKLYFDRSLSVKFYENSHGVSWSRFFQDQQIQLPVQLPVIPPQSPEPPQQPTQE